MPTKQQMSQQKLSQVNTLQSNLSKTNSGQQGLSRAISLRSSSSITAAAGSGKAKTPKPRTHMGNKPKQKVKRSTKTRIKQVQKKPRKAIKQMTIQSGLKRLTAQKGKMVTDSVKRKHIDQAIDDVVSGHVCQAGSNCTDPTALTDGPTMNVSSALIQTGMHANGTTEQIRETQNDSTAMQHNYSQQDVANQIPQNSRQQVTDVCQIEQPDVNASLVQTQGATFTEEGLNNLITQIMEKTMSGLSGMGWVPVDVAHGDSDVRRLMTIASTATPAGTNSSVNTRSLERENQVNGVSIGRPCEDHRRMSGSPRRRRARCEEDISGQFRVTVPDAGESDQLRTWGGVYRRGLYTSGSRDNAPPERTRSLPASSLESSTEPMDKDDARRASEEIYRRIRQQAGLSRSGLVGDVTLQPEPLGVMTQGRLVLRRRTSEQPQAGQLDVRDQPVGDPDTTTGAVGGVTLLNIPPCSMAEEPGEQSQSLFRPPMSDPELDLERQRGTRPKVAGPLTTQTIQEEA